MISSTSNPPTRVNPPAAVTDPPTDTDPPIPTPPVTTRAPVPVLPGIFSAVEAIETVLAILTISLTVKEFAIPTSPITSKVKLGRVVPMPTRSLASSKKKFVAPSRSPVSPLN